MTDEDKSYADYVVENGETKRDIDVVYNPIMKGIKTAFALMFSNDGMTGSDFKRLSDMRFYQGGYPSPTTPPKEHSLAVQVANLMRLENSLDKHEFCAFLGAMGIRCEVVSPISETYTLSKDDEKKLKDAWGHAGIDAPIPTDKKLALELLMNRSQNLQHEICDVTDSIKVLAAEEVEDKFKIKKSNFLKAVNLQAIKLKRGDGVMGEKLDDVVDSMDNLQEAIAPLLKGAK